MNASVFQEVNYYFEQSLKLFVYAYEQMKKDKSANPYSRRSIRKITGDVRGHCQDRNEIEDFLRNDLVNNYLKKHMRLFNLDYFSIQAGVEETKQNVKIGIVDIKFELISASNLEGYYFIFECKRINKYAGSHDDYIKDGMMRFLSGQYYPECEMAVAGMIAFVEIDIEKKPGGYLPIEKVANLLKLKIDLQKTTFYKLSPYNLIDDKYPEISNFNYSFLSKHHRDSKNREISLHHLLFNYYEILVS
jgi:hypothetical protein